MPVILPACHGLSVDQLATAQRTLGGGRLWRHRHDGRILLGEPETLARALKQSQRPSRISEWEPTTPKGAALVWVSALFQRRIDEMNLHAGTCPLILSCPIPPSTTVTCECGRAWVLDAEWERARRRERCPCGCGQPGPMERAHLEDYRHED